MYNTHILQFSTQDPFFPWVRYALKMENGCDGLVVFWML